MSRRRADLAVVVGVALLVPACAAGARQPHAPLAADPIGLASRRPIVGPFRVAIRGEVRGGRGRAIFTAGVAWTDPDLRIDVFHPIGGRTLLTLAVSKGEARALWPDRGECLVAPAQPELFAALLGLTLMPEELPALLAGTVYRDAWVDFDSVRFAPLGVSEPGTPAPSGRDRLLVAGRDRQTGARFTAELDAARDGAALRGERTGIDGGVIQVSYPRWVATAPAHPERIRLAVPDRKLRLDLKVEEWSATAAAANAFQLELPADCMQRTIDELNPAWDREP